MNVRRCLLLNDMCCCMDDVCAARVPHVEDSGGVVKARLVSRAA
jgi:hypothetical protein